jgi:hypothetical protein
MSFAGGVLATLLLSVVVVLAVLLLYVGAVLGVVATVAGVAAGAGTAAAVVPVAPQFTLCGLPPRLPAAMALPVAVQPAPGVEDFVSAGAVWASATPATSAEAAASVAKESLFMRVLLEGCLDMART